MPTILALACAEPTPEGRSVSSYEVAATEDVSVGEVRRLNVRVELPQHYSREQIELIASEVVDDVTDREPLNALSVMFFGPSTSIAGAWDVGLVEWAPNGQWSDAEMVQAGRYESFRFSVTYMEPTSLAANTLRTSGESGLLGAPLPEGAVLVGSNEGGGSQAPSQRYELNASAEEIEAFFQESLAEAGWEQNGSPSSGSFFFTRGSLILGVLISGEGGSFTLISS